ncbi:MAG: 30S ribosomal protein S8 [Patescibacteria group bacterium]
MMTDPISDMLTRVRNAAMARAHVVEMPLSKMKFAIAKILESRGYLVSVEKVTDKATSREVLRLTLAYAEGMPIVSDLKRISKPGRRVYVKADDVRAVRSGYGISIISTPNGVMSGDDARKRRLGGEFICEVY